MLLNSKPRSGNNRGDTAGLPDEPADEFKTHNIKEIQMELIEDIKGA